MTIAAEAGRSTNLLNRIYSLSPGTGGFSSLSKAMASQSAALNVDEREVSATALISTPHFDRQGDSINPLGGKYENYARNPVVFYDHGLTLTTPIGVSEDKDGVLLVWPTKHGIRAKCMFSQRNKEAMQIFDLVAERILRAASIRFKPLQRPITKSEGLRYEEWDAEEWSFTGLGVNPYAVREVIAKGMLNSEQIVPSVMKSLNAIVGPYKRKFVTGSRLKMLVDDEGNQYHVTEDDLGVMTVSPMDAAKQQNGPTIAKKPKPGESSGDPEQGPPSEKPKPGEEGEEENMNDESVNEEVPEEEVEEGAEEGEAMKKMADMPYGAQLLDSAHMKMSDLMETLKSGCGSSLEHPAVRKMMEDTQSGLGPMSETLKGGFAENYPDYQMTQKEQTDGAKKEKEKVKSLLAESQSRRLQTMSLSTQLKQIAKHPMLPTSVRKSLKQITGSLDGVIREAKRIGPTDDEAKISQLEAAITKRTEQLKGMIPANRHKEFNL